MTRDEALAKLWKAFTDDFGGSDVRMPSTLVVGLEALGLLKLDEPKSVEDRAGDIFKDMARLAKAGIPFDAFSMLSAAGLKIVEK